MNIESNTKAVGSTDSLASSLSKEAEQYQSVLDFEKDYKNNPRNVFVYAPERVNTDLLGAVAAVANDGLYVPNTPDLFPISHTLTNLENRKLSNLTGFSLSISSAFQIQNGFYTDTSTGNITTGVYFVMGYVPYSVNGEYNNFVSGPNSFYYPIFQARMGTLTWTQASSTFIYRQFNNTYNLLNTIPLRPQGTLYRNFSIFPEQIDDNDLRILTEQQLMLAIGITFEAQSNFADTDFIQNQDILGGYPGVAFRISYAFNYYALLANF